MTDPSFWNRKTLAATSGTDGIRSLFDPDMLWTTLRKWPVQIAIFFSDVAAIIRVVANQMPGHLLHLQCLFYFSLATAVRGSIFSWGGW